MTEDMNDVVEQYLRQLTDAESPEARTAIYDAIVEKNVSLLGEVMIAMIEYQAAVIDHLTSQLAEVEFPREGKRLDLKDARYSDEELEKLTAKGAEPLELNKIPPIDPDKDQEVCTAEAKLEVEMAKIDKETNLPGEVWMRDGKEIDPNA